MSTKPQRDLFKAMEQVRDWLWNSKERTTVNREWDQQYITDAALILMTVQVRLEDKVAELHKELNSYKDALQRDNDPKFEAYIGELADKLEARFSSDVTADAARQLRYMATSFTSKANFVPMRMDLEAVKKVCCFSNGELRYVKNPGSGLYWCHTHNRAAEWIRLPLGIEEPMHVCNPNLGGITMPCRVAKRL